ncbi:SIMPL domain-containing protein [Gracilibacillus xinjiangensis]|uniref:SIMPL domain-containing protein n=1 Tax=Gracilibacillus xinjiangensis TaxID=1193282 RepID=A0ABV8WVH1_9BACI
MDPFHPPEIVVYGTSVIALSPDLVTIELGVVKEGKSAQAVQQETNTIMAQVYKALFTQNVHKDSIQTIEISIYPQYDYMDGSQLLKGFIAANMISLQTTDLSNIGDLLDIAVRNGANRISNITFRVLNEDYYYQHALQSALHNGYQKALTIANRSLTPVSIKELTAANSTLYKASHMEYSTSSPVPISPGKIEIEAKVEMIYCIS